MLKGFDSMNKFALEIKTLNTSFNGFSLKDINLTLEKGCIMGLIGENGAGKTTLIKSIMNMYYTKDAKIQVYGHDHVDDEVIVKNLIGYVAAEDYFIPGHTLKMMANYFRVLYDNWNTSLFNDYVAKWKLPLNKPFSTYSKGMKTKAMLILALAHEPRFLLLDEPTVGLDPLVKVEVLDILRNFVDNEEKSVLFSTHITTDLDKVADFITLIHNGAILESDAMDNISDKYAVVSGSETILKAHKQDLIGATGHNGILEAIIPRTLTGNLPKEQISLKQPTIEELMIHLIKESR